MKRILILGSGGAGKSTLAKKLGSKLNLPVIHLDAYYWNPGWVETPYMQWEPKVRELISGESWVMDGNYSTTLRMRIEKADTIIFLDMPRIKCIYRILKRRIQYHGKTRPDMNAGCPEKMDMAFFKWVWNFKNRAKAKVVKALEETQNSKKIIILKREREIKQFVNKLP